jgi:hypothetical protein
MVEGATLRQLGERHGITYERVRQLFKEYNLPTKKVKRQTVKRQNYEQEAQARKQEIFECYKRHGTVEKTAECVGIPKQYISPILSEMGLRQLYRKKGTSPSYPPDFIVECLQTAAELQRVKSGDIEEPLTIPTYRKMAPAFGFPADLTVIRAFGTWEAACAAAGVKANPSEGPRRGAITPELCIEALRLCRADLDRIPSYEIYCKWARDTGMPSGPTVRVKVGPWRQALSQAFGGG